MVLFLQRLLNIVEYLQKWLYWLIICALLAFPAQSSSDPASHCHFTEVHLWKTHFGQTREILHEEWIRTGTNRRSYKRPLVIKFTACLWWGVWAGAPPPHERCSIAIEIPSRHLEELPKRQIDFSWECCENDPCRCGPSSGWAPLSPKHKPMVNDVIDVFAWFSYYLVHWNFFTL